MSWQLGIFCGLAFFLSVILNRYLPVFLNEFGKNKEKGPRQFRWSQSSKPLTGGMAMAIPVIGFTGLSFFSGEMNGILLLFFGMSLLAGLTDDLISLKPWPKLLVQFVCGGVAWWAGLKIELSGNLPLDLFITAFTLSALMNSVNMLDNMDGVTGFALLGILIPWITFTSDDITILLWVSIVSIIGFLFFNSYPSKVFMGDSGSHFLAAVLFWFCFEFPLNGQSLGGDWEKAWTIYALLLFPITDSVIVTASRVLRQQSPFIGGRDHLTHVLVVSGMRQSTIPWILFSCNVILGIWVRAIQPEWIWIMGIVVGIQVFFAFTYYKIWNNHSK